MQSLKGIAPEAPPREVLYDLSVLNDEARWTTNNVHDPAIIRAHNGRYYVYSTDVKVGGEATPGVQIRRSRDLIRWEWVGRALDGVPAEARRWTGARGLWAPDVQRWDGRYYLYYSASQFGRNQSFIGMATATSPEGPWSDEGEVIRSRQGDEANAIDPCIAFDATGQPWLAYGSFFGGIYLLPLDRKTGKPTQRGVGTLLVRRSMRVHNAVEAPCLVYHPRFRKYYLFVSYDSLFSDYNVRVARADRITGPYTDYHRRPMTDTESPPDLVGLKILAGYRFEESEGWIAPGHNAVLLDGNRWFIAHHARGARDRNWPYLHIRRIFWTPDGWPVVSPERYAGEGDARLSRELLVGEWERIVLEPTAREAVKSEPMHLSTNGKARTETANGEWVFTLPNLLRLRWAAGEETLLVSAAWDWERWKPTLVFTGLSSKGVAVWGKRK